MATTWKRALIIGLALVLAIAGVFALAIRANRQARLIRWEDEPVRAWMSVPFIAHTHHVPASTLFQAIGVHPHEPRDRRSVRRIARDEHRRVPEMIDELQRALDAAGHSPSGGKSQ